jgi:hypothetical protein
VPSRREQIAIALKRAHQAGDSNAARKLAAAYNQTDGAAPEYLGALPGEATDPGLFEKSLPEPTRAIDDPLGAAVGTVEAAGTLTTGATTGAAGMVGGFLKGVAESILRGDFGTQQAGELIAKSAESGAQALTYEPRTEAGQRQVAAVGEALEPLTPLLAVTPVEGAAAAAGIAAAASPVSAGARATASKAAQGVRQAIGKTEPSPGAAGPRSAGAADVGAATVRDQLARELPVPIKLTQGQKTREFGQLQFERETAKNAKVGGAMRERLDEQNAQLVQNIDAFIEGTGGVAPDLRSVGLSVEKGIRVKALRDKRRIRTLYKEAEKAGELETTVQLDALAKYLDDSRSLDGTAKNLPAVRAEAKRLGILAEGPDGKLTAQPTTLANGELLRKFINKATGNDKTEQLQAVELKKVYDAATKDAGGALYKRARDAYSKYQDDFVNQVAVKNILGTKRGSSDRAIAYEDVLNRTVVSPSTSLDQLEGVFRLLNKSAPGKQAIADLKAGTLEWLKGEATKNVGTTSAGDKVFSAAGFNKAITQLDKSGKLDFVFGKKGAEQLRTLNEIAQDVLTVPAGAVNTSNTASALASMADLVFASGTGIPAPLASAIKLLRGQIKDAKLKKRLDESLGNSSGTDQ